MQRNLSATRQPRSATDPRPARPPLALRATLATAVVLVSIAAIAWGALWVLKHLESSLAMALGGVAILALAAWLLRPALDWLERWLAVEDGAGGRGGAA